LKAILAVSIIPARNSIRTDNGPNSIEQRRKFMRHCGLIASSFTLAMVVGSQAIAQQQPANPAAGGTPDVIPFDIPYGMPITAEKAKQILAAAEAEAMSVVGKRASQSSIRMAT
jgi:hypothetical protein